MRLPPPLTAIQLLLPALFVMLAGCGKETPTATPVGPTPPAPAAPADNGPSESVSWTDPAGDIGKNNDGRPGLDIVRVDASGQEGVLRIKFTLKDPLEQFTGYQDNTGRKYGDVLASLFIDSDQNENTGGFPNWAHEADRPLKGYDFTLDVLMGFGFRSDPSDSFSLSSGNCIVDPAKGEIGAAGGTLWIHRLMDNSDSWDFKFKTPDDFKETAQASTTLLADGVEIALRYEWMRLEAGRTLRLCFKECGEGAASGKGISPDRLLILR